MNKVTLIGHLTADAEIRTLPDGGRVASLRMATNEHWTDKQSGERKSRAEFHRVVTYNTGLIDAVIEPWATKGKQVVIEGSIRTRKWTDERGQDRYTTEVVIGPRGTFQLLGSAPKGEAAEPETSPAPKRESVAAAGDLVDDDIPF